MTTLTHRIRRLTWRARTRSVDEAFLLRQRLRRLAQTDLLPELERAFEAAAGGVTLRLPRIELSIRVSDTEEIPAAVAAGIRQHAEWRRTADEARGDARRDVPDVGRQDLLRYLRTGILPWPLANLGSGRTDAILTEMALESTD